MDNEELLQRIRQAKEEGRTELSIRRNRLTSLPPEIGQLTNLKILDFGYNRLTELPPQIGRLTELRSLYLGGCELFTKVGSGISYNQLADLPPEIGQLTNLRELDLRCNRLTSLPPEIGQLTNLKKLRLGGNQLTRLLPEIGQLANLERLDLDDNWLTELPPEIGQLTNLRELDLSDNPISASLPLDPRRPTLVIQRVLQRQRSLRACPRSVWTWLQSERVEHLLHDAFTAACDEAMKDYDSGEVSITGGLCTSLRMTAKSFRDEIEKAWQVAYPGTHLGLNIDYRDLQKRHDVGGADFVIGLNVDVPGFHKRYSFSAFQAKRLDKARFSLSSKEQAQLGVLRNFTAASYYLFYLALDDPLPPVVLPARTLSGYLEAKGARSVSLDEIHGVGRSLADYLVYDFFPGWSGDERAPDKVEEFVIHNLNPRHLLTINISAEGEQIERREG